MKLHPLEILPVLVYLIILLFIGFKKKVKEPTQEDFILGGRSLTLPAFIATLVTTWYGGILGVGEYTYLYGLSNWVVFGVPYYIFAILFAIFLAPKIQSTHLMSIPDQFYTHYGKSSGILGAIFTLFMTLPAPYILMVGLLIQLLTGWDLWLCIVLGTLFSMIYVFTGGFRAVVRTDKLQFVLMFGGFALLLAVLISQYGGFSFLSHQLPGTHLSWHGGNNLATILAWFFIASWTFIDPGFHQRCYAAKTPQLARRGILISVLFWFVFDFLTTSTGLYARALLTDINPVLSFPLLGHEMLSPLFSGIFLTALLATIMSTVDSLSLLSAITVGYDLLPAITRVDKQATVNTRRGLVIMAVLSILLAITFPSVIQLWFILGNIFIPPMLFPVIACYYPRLRPSPPWILANLILPFLISLAFLGISIYQSESLTNIQMVWDLPPMYPGLLISTIIFILGLLIKNKKNKSR